MRRASPLALLLISCAGCPGGGGNPDGGDGDGDAGPADAAIDADIDASGPCGNQTFLTGDYVDWDSSETDFLGIFEAEVKDVDAPGTTDLTAPNGRTELCVSATGDRIISFEHDDYVRMTFTMDQEAAAAGPFSAHGITPARMATLYSTDLGSLPLDTNKALAVVEVRYFPSGDPVIGTTIALTEAHDGAWTPDADGNWVPGATITDAPQILFGNVPDVQPADGRTPVVIMPPDGVTCVGPATLAIAPGELATTTIACTN